MMIALTGWGREGDRIRTEEAGFDHDLVKSVVLDHLADIVTFTKGLAQEPVQRPSG